MNFDDIVRIIFSKLIQCELTKVSLSTIYENEALPIVQHTEPPPAYFGVPANRNHVEVTETNDDTNLYYLLARGDDTIGDEYFEYFGIQPLINAQLTIAQIATVMGNDGNLQIVNPPDLILVRDYLHQYLNTLESARIAIHFKEPPPEDVALLRNLKDIVDSVIKLTPEKNLASMLGYNNTSATGVVSGITLRKTVPTQLLEGEYKPFGFNI